MQETTPRIAPVLTLSIVTYNSEKWLQAFFESLLKQDLPCDQIALCVLDNGSTDGSREIAEAHGGRIGLANREGGGLQVSLVLPVAED